MVGRRVIDLMDTSFLSGSDEGHSDKARLVAGSTLHFTPSFLFHLFSCLWHCASDGEDDPCLSDAPVWARIDVGLSAYESTRMIACLYLMSFSTLRIFPERVRASDRVAEGRQYPSFLATGRSVSWLNERTRACDWADRTSRIGRLDKTFGGHLG